MTQFLSGRSKIAWTLPSESQLDPEGVFIGVGALALEVAVARSHGRPTSAILQRAWRDRLAGRPNPLIVVALYGTRAAVCGPGGEPPPVYWDIEIEAAERICDAALGEPNRHAAWRLIESVFGGLEDELLGLRNEGLLATYYLKARMPQRPDWAEASRRASEVMDKRGRELLAGLGFEIETIPGPAHILLAKDTRVAVAVFLHGGEAFDQAQDRFVGKSPVAYALAQAQKHNLQYVVATAEGRIRLYLTDPSGGVAPRGPTETFVELYLDLLPPKDAAYLWFLFSEDALSSEGTMEEALHQSRDYSADLGKRLRERIYVDVLPELGKAVAAALGIREPTKEELDLAHRTAMTVLFRLLFVAYAEDRGLLPYGRNPRYRSRSLKEKAKELLSVVREGGSFDPASTSHWADVSALFRAIYCGNREWGVPEYDGDLFSPDPEISLEGSKLEKVQLSNDVFGPVLSRLLLDWIPEGVQGPVDFRSLGVREFGVIYEGLLESELSIAEQPLTVDANGNYLPAREGEEASILVGQFYMHNVSGQRKSTGTYYTKDFIVDHLLQHSLEPALDDHLKRLNSLSDREAEAAFFDFRVADIAMGSGHFLVAAVDRIEQRLSAYLTERQLEGVGEELDRLRDAASRAVEDSEVEPSIDDRALLRRQIARRCIYGVDLNPLAVQLARLSLWTHTFVPGLPLSFLNHNLVCGNSLIGVATFAEAAEALKIGKENLLVFLAAEQVEAVQKALEKLGRLADADAKEIRAARDAQERLDRASAPGRALFDLVAASRVEASIDATSVLTSSTGLESIVDSPLHLRSAEILKSLNPFHFPTAFPEVFRGERRGFDVIVGNPPWEEATLEEDDFWTRYVPGLQGLPQREQERIQAEWRHNRPDLVRKFEEEANRQALVREFLVNGPFPGMGTGDPDVYKAFCWRFWHLVREGGYVGVVLPRSAFGAKGSEAFRRHLLGNATFSDLTFLLNSGFWVFDSTEQRYTIALSSSQKREPSKATTLPLRGPYRSFEEFREGVQQEPSRFHQTEVPTWTDSAAFPLLPTAQSIGIFRNLRESPNLSDAGPDEWRALAMTELHATSDKVANDGTTLMHFVETPPEGYWPIYKGASFDLWKPDTGQYYAWGDPEVLTSYLQAKRRRAARNPRSGFHAMDPEWVQDKETLPCLDPRIAFRDVTNRTNRRTVIAALIPPRVFITNKGPYFIWPRGDEKDEAFLLGVLASIPLDWYARRFVETNVNFHILYGFPIPRPSRDDPLWKRVVQVAGRLAAVDDRYVSWAEAVGVEHGDLSPEAKRELIHELDAVVAHLYGLSEDDVRHIFETFHEGWDYSDRLEGVLKHYRDWEGER